MSDFKRDIKRLYSKIKSSRFQVDREGEIYLNREFNLSNNPNNNPNNKLLKKS